MNYIVILNTPFVVSSLGGIKKPQQNKSTWGNISMTIYYWLDELEFKSQKAGNIRIRDLVEYRLPEYASNY